MDNFNVLDNLNIIETNLTQPSDWIFQIFFFILAILIGASLIFFIRKYVLSKK